MRTRTMRSSLRAIVALGALSGLSAAACGDGVGPEELTPPEPSFHIGDEQPIRMTGGGRIDSPDGDAEKNTPESRVFQTFGFNVGDRDGDGAPEGNFQFVDHTPENRVKGRPVNLHSVEWHTFVRTVDGCEDAGIEATGIIELRNTGERHEFRLYACDNGEPGVGNDILQLTVFYSPDNIRYRWGGLLTGGNLQAHFDQSAGDGETSTTGDLDVSTSTTGSDLDADGYTVVVDGTQSQAIGVNATVRFADLEAGDHGVELTGVASNCTVGGSNPRTVSVTAGEVASTTFSVTCEATGGTVTTRITGLGSIGPGTATPGSTRQDFDFDVTDAPGGTLAYTDWAVVRADGSVGTVTVDPSTDPETGISSFARSTIDPACVEFGGTGRVDTGELAVFTVDACDYGTPGTGTDVFAFSIPSRSYARGPDQLSEGEITLSDGS